ncbi:hypothetical protein Aduo_009193 [Ancylostoma duodenale]
MIARVCGRVFVAASVWWRQTCHAQSDDVPLRIMIRHFTAPALITSGSPAQIEARNLFRPSPQVISCGKAARRRLLSSFIGLARLRTSPPRQSLCPLPLRLEPSFSVASLLLSFFRGYTQRRHVIDRHSPRFLSLPNVCCGSDTVRVFFHQQQLRPIVRPVSSEYMKISVERGAMTPCMQLDRDFMNLPPEICARVIHSRLLNA